MSGIINYDYMDSASIYNTGSYDDLSAYSQYREFPQPGNKDWEPPESWNVWPSHFDGPVQEDDDAFMDADVEKYEYGKRMVCTFNLFLKVKSRIFQIEIRLANELVLSICIVLVYNFKE